MSFKVTFVQTDGVEKTLANLAAGESLMEAARMKNVGGILGDCGGSCACATCHVYIDPAWQAIVGMPDDVERATLEMVSDLYRPDSRLCCQIQMRAELDGLRVIVAPSL